MNISSWSIRNPVPAVLCFILLTLFGLIGFHKLQVQDFPDMDLPTISISASLEGAAPSQLENEVARKIEDKLTSLSKLDHITTKITDGAVSISVSFKLEKDPQTALSEVRNAVDGARASLPSEMAAPTVSKSDAANSALLTYTASSATLDEQDLSWFVDNDLAKALLSVKGVSKVERIGGIDREVHVDLNPALMAGLGLTAETVSSQLTAMQRERSGGQGDIGGQRQSARTLIGVGSAADVAALTLATGDGRRVRLDQIARVTDGATDRASYAFLDGKPVVGVQITRAKGNSDVTVLHDVRNAIATFAGAHPEVRLVEASNTVSPIEDNYEGSMSMLIEGALLAIAVVWWFLRDGRATLVSAAALPLSIIPTFGVIYLAGYSLNTITLLALSLVVGILVDDAIVEIENIERHLRMGKTPYQAAMEAADEIGLAVIATTFALVAVFLPTAFMSGIPGLIFRQFGVTASVAVLMSLLVARLLTPMMAAYLMKATGHAERDSPLMTQYLRWVGGGLDKRGRTMLAAGLMLLLSLAMAAALKTGFFPAQDKAQTQVTLELTPGSTLEQSRAVALQAEALIRRLPEVKGVFSTVGSASDSGNPATGTSSTADVRTSTLVVDLVARGERKSKQSAVEEAIRHQLRDLPGVRVAVNNGGNGEKLQITLAGSDATALESAAAALESQLRTLHGIGNVTSSAALQRPEVQFRPDPARAAALGVTTEAAADAIRIGTYGAYSTALPKLNLPERQIAIRARIDPALRQDLDAIGQLRVAGTNGSVTVASVGTLSIGSGPVADRPARPRAQHHAVGRAQRPHHRRGQPGGAAPAGAAALAGRRPPGPARRAAEHERAVPEFRLGHGHRRVLRVCGARAPVPRLPAAGHHPVRAAAVAGRRAALAADHADELFHARADRPADADGHRDQEFDPAGRVRHHGPARARPEPAGGLDGRLPQAGPPDRDDDHRHGSRHAAQRARPGGGTQLPPAHGHRRDRRAAGFDAAEPARDPRGVHLRGRPGAVAAPPVPAGQDPSRRIAAVAHSP